MIKGSRVALEERITTGVTSVPESDHAPVRSPMSITSGWLLSHPTAVRAMQLIPAALLAGLLVVVALTSWFPIPRGAIARAHLPHLAAPTYRSQTLLVPVLVALGALVVQALLFRRRFVVAGVLSAGCLLLAGQADRSSGGSDLLGAAVVFSVALLICGWIVGLLVARHSVKERDRLVGGYESAALRLRTTLANSLHDTIGSRNAEIYWQVAEMLSAAPVDAPYRGQLGSLLELTRRNADGMRSALASLTLDGSMADELDDDHYADVAEYLESRRQILTAAGINAQVCCDPSVSTLDRSISTLVMRVCREATANAARYGCNPCVVNIFRDLDRHMVEVIYINARQPPSTVTWVTSESGLVTLRKMIHAIGGQLDYGRLEADQNSWFLRAQLPDRVGYD